MTDQYTELRRALAAGPAPGPWSHDSGIVPPDGPGRYSTISAEDDDLSIAEVNDLIPEGAANAAYIAAANPTTINTLLAERDAQAVEIERLQSRNARQAKTIRRYQVGMARLRKSLHELLTSLSESDDEGLMEHAEVVIAARAALSQGEPT